jgi:uncharacterized protein YecT (DUF1311 family)
MVFANRLWGRFDMKTLSTFAAACLMMGIPAMAQDEPQVDCDNAQTQVEMNYCAHVDWEAADTELNSTYKDVREALKVRDRDLVAGELKAADRLLDAQRAWIAYRDAHCEVDSFSARGGSMQPMLYSGCLATVTRNRTKQLGSLVSEYLVID